MANDGEMGLLKALGEDYNLIILDLMLPGVDGFEICRRVRDEKNTPIIMISAKKDDIDKMDEQIELHLLVDNMSAMIYALYINFVGFFAEKIVNGIKNYGEFCRKYNVKRPIIVKTKDRADLAGANMQPLPVKELKAAFDILSDNPNIQINIV